MAGSKQIYTAVQDDTQSKDILHTEQQQCGTWL